MPPSSFVSSLASPTGAARRATRELPGKEVRHPEGERRIVQPMRPRSRIRLREDRVSEVVFRVVRDRITNGVQMIQKIGAQLIPIPAPRYPPHSSTPDERKAGAECEVADVSLRVKIRRDSHAALDLGNEMEEAARAGETQ